MTGEEFIVTFNEPWYTDYQQKLYTQLTEQMYRDALAEFNSHKEPVITNIAFDEAVDRTVFELVSEYRDLVNITERYKNHE